MKSGALSKPTVDREGAQKPDSAQSKWRTTVEEVDKRRGQSSSTSKNKASSRRDENKSHVGKAEARCAVALGLLGGIPLVGGVWFGPTVTMSSRLVLARSAFAPAFTTSRRGIAHSCKRSAQTLGTGEERSVSKEAASGKYGATFGDHSAVKDAEAGIPPASTPAYSMPGAPSALDKAANLFFFTEIMRGESPYKSTSSILCSSGPFLPFSSSSLKACGSC